MNKLFHCEKCEDKMQIIATNPNSTFWLDDTEPCTLYVCTSGDCSNRGIVMCLPSELKED